VDASYNWIDEVSLLESLRGGDESAFSWLVQQYHNSMMRLALLYVQDNGLAEEVAQETWVAVLKGLNRFEGRSSIKTWIFTILTNQAKTRGRREKRTVSFSELEEALENKPTVDPKRFKPSNSAASADHWFVNPSSWKDIPEEAFLSQEMLHMVWDTVSTLPENQRVVITLRDMEGFSSNEVCNILGISETNHRVLLHRARAKVRSVLEDYLNSEN